MTETETLTPPEEAFFRTLHAAAITSAKPNEKGQWQFTGPYGTDAHKALARRQQESAKDKHKPGYYIKNNMMGIFSEAVADTILGHPVEARIEQYIKGLGGDGGRDGEIHGIPYDVKTTVGNSGTITFKGGIGNKDKKMIFIFSKLTIDEEPLQRATIIFDGYAWRPDVLPFALQGSQFGTSICLQNLPAGTLEPDLTKLRDRDDPKFNQKMGWPENFPPGQRKWPVWCEPEDT
jgi:hypothetical protein